MRLSAAGYACDVGALGSTLRRLIHDGHDLVVPAGAHDPPGLFRGVTVAPWPNRVADGRYRFAGIEQRLPVNETDRGHALHGFSVDREWTVFEDSATRAVLRLDCRRSPATRTRCGCRRSTCCPRPASG